MIPKVIIQYWDQGSPPDEIQKLMTTWIEKNPDFEHRLYCRQSAREFLLQNFGDTELELFDIATLPAMRSDIFRVAYIFLKGGIYIDAATTANLPITRLIKAKNSVNIMTKWHGGIWNGFICAPPQSFLLGCTWAKIKKNLNDKSKDDIWEATGPGVFSDVLQTYSFDDITFHKQEKVKPIFDLVNDLEHKKNNHWSRQQKIKSIFKTDSTDQENVFNEKESFNSNLKLFLHLSPIVEATTSIQNIVNDNQPLFSKNGISVLNERGALATEYTAWLKEYRKVLNSYLHKALTFEDAKKRFIFLFLNIFSLTGTRTHSLLLNDFGILSPIINPLLSKEKKHNPSVYKALPLILAALNEISIKHEIEIKIVTCKTDLVDIAISSFIESTYLNDSSERLLNYYKRLKKNLLFFCDDFYQRLGNEFHGIILDFPFNSHETLQNIFSDILGKNSIRKDMIITPNQLLKERIEEYTETLKQKKNIAFSIFFLKRFFVKFNEYQINKFNNDLEKLGSRVNNNL